MKLKRDVVKVFRMDNDDDDDNGFVKGKPDELFEMVWEITCDVWTFGGRGNAERRLK